MLPKKQRVWIEILIILFWVLSINFLSAVSILSTESFIYVFGLDQHLVGNELAQYWLSPQQFLESTLFGIFFGLIFVIVDRFFRRVRFSRMAFGRIIFLKSLYYFLGMAFTFLAIYLILLASGSYSNQMASEIKIGAPIVLLVTLVLMSIGGQILFLNFLLQTVENNGSYNIARFLTGKYQQPVEEERVFMFLDLKDSTPLAEHLGNVKYSKLIQESFNDLNSIARKYNAEIYQYVGDEIVLTWNNLSQDYNLECIQLFFAFDDLLKARRDFYLEKFGVLPEFKAGCNEGSITATEVGFLKREIAFHGDVINTASRIQKLNSTLGTDILISTEMKSRLPESDNWEIETMGEQKLRGKDQPVEIFKIKRNAA